MEKDYSALYVGPGGTYKNVPLIREIAKQCNGNIDRFKEMYFEHFRHTVEPFPIESPHFKSLWNAGGQGLVRVA